MKIGILDPILPVKDEYTFINVAKKWLGISYILI